MDTRSNSKRNKLIILGSVLLIFLLAPFLGPRIWVASQFNKVGNIILSNSNVNKIYEMTIDGLIVWSYDLYGDSVAGGPQLCCGRVVYVLSGLAPYGGCDLTKQDTGPGERRDRLDS